MMEKHIGNRFILVLITQMVLPQILLTPQVFRQDLSGDAKLCVRYAYGFSFSIQEVPGRALGTANVTYGTEGMRIDASGDVSIPSGDLDVTGNATGNRYIKNNEKWYGSSTI